MSDSIYDSTDINAAYDQARALPSGMVDLWMEAIGEMIPSERLRLIVDVGCGTGRFSGGLAASLGAEVIGVDLYLFRPFEDGHYSTLP